MATLQTSHADDVQYIYDSLNRLVEARYPDKVIRYTYDAVGNRTSEQVFSINPIPTLASLSPDNKIVGGAAFTLTVNGTNFASGATVKWNGTDRPTTFVNIATLTANITAADIAVASTANVTVVNADPTNGASSPLSFSINNPVPVITGVTPAGAQSGGATTILTVNGTDFVTGTVGRWNGASRATSVLSNAQLTMVVSDTDLSTPGSTNITVVNPAPGGGASNGSPFTVAPCSGALSPAGLSFTPSAASGGVSVVTPTGGCAWTATSNVPWITITSGSSGTGNGAVNYSILANSGPARTGAITIAGNTFTATQASGCGMITILPTTLTAGTSGTPYPITTLMASGGTSPYTFTIPVGSLPAGMNLSAGGVLDGTPTASGTFNFTVRATDNGGTCFGEQAYSLVINSECLFITVNPTSLPNGFVGTLYTQALSASSGTPSYTFTLNSGSFPNGLSIVGTNLTGTPTTTGVFTFTIKATDSLGCMGTRTYTVVISGTGLQFYPLAHPVRMVDTRVGATACQTPGAAITGNTSLTVPARGVCDGLTIPANAAAVTGNVTTVGPVAAGFLTIYPNGATRPQASNSNYQTNQTLNNVFTVGLGAADGAFNVYALSTTNVVVDVTGYFAPPGANGLFFHPLPAPVRLLDTRAGQTACTTPGTPLLAATEFLQQGNAICGIPATALALVGNATTVGPLAQGFLTLFPADATRPNIASGNYQSGQTLNSPFTVGLSPSGQFKIYSLQQTNLVVDVLGYYSADASDMVGIGLLFSPMTPARLLDTRAGQTACFIPGVAIPATTDTPQPARGTCTIPATAQAIVGNATTVSPASGGFLTFWPSNATRPNAATSNFAAGVNFNRHYTVGLGADGAFNIYALTSTHLVVDVSGSFAP